MKKLFGSASLNTDLATLVLRLVFGGLFMYGGWFKLDSYNMMLTMFGDPIGLGTKLSLNLVIFAELGCGFLVLIGLLTRLAVIPIFISMNVVMFVAVAKQPFLEKQYPFLLYILCIVVFILGSGKYSADRLFMKRNSPGPVLFEK